MSDNDSTFINKSFQEILEKNQIIHQPNILDDHHSLGLIDRFARTLKMILTRLFLQTKSTNWIDYLDKIIKNYNNNGHSAIDYISPNEAFLKKNFEKIYNINYEKSLFNISIWYDFAVIKLNHLFESMDHIGPHSEIRRVSSFMVQYRHSKCVLTKGHQNAAACSYAARSARSGQR
jgi:hypothetical protein